MVKKVSILVVALLVIYVIYSLADMGVFRKIENKFDGSIVKTIDLPGDEDMIISFTDSFALVSSTDRLTYPPTTNEVGSLYYMELKSGNFNIKPLKTNLQGPFAPHGISMIKLGDHYKVMAVNGKIDSRAIEVFKLIGDSLIHEKTLSDPAMISPNDVLAIDENRFYFTNDHKYTVGFGRTMEEYLGLKVSGVMYFDGKNYKSVAGDCAYANGLFCDTVRKLVYVAASRDFLVKVYSLKPVGTLDFIEDIPVGSGVDNVHVGREGAIWCGCHPNLLALGSYEQGKSPKAPSELIKVVYKGKGDYTVESVFVDDGTKMSASTIAAPFGEYILAGNLMDKKFLILKRNSFK